MKKYSITLLTLPLLFISIINGYGQSLYLRTNSVKVDNNYDYLLEQYKYTNFLNDQYITSIFRFTPDGKLIINDSPPNIIPGLQQIERRSYEATLDVASPSKTVPTAIFGVFEGSTYKEQIRFTGNGQIGIGITTPTEKLEVNGTIKATSFKFSDGTTLSNTSQWTTSGTSINYAAGNIGIANAAPTAKLEIGVDELSGNISETADPIYLKVHGSSIFDNDANNALTQVSINTKYQLAGSALTVGGPTFIGSWDETKIITDAPKINPDYLAKYNLWVTKGVVSEDFAITSKGSWKDEVFKEGYKLPTLNEVETFVKQYKHLPGVPSEKEVMEKGYTVHQMNNAFLEKIEHLVLYSIEQEKKLKEQAIQMNTFKARLEAMETKLETLSNQK